MNGNDIFNMAHAHFYQTYFVECFFNLSVELLQKAPYQVFVASLMCASQGRIREGGIDCSPVLIWVLLAKWIGDLLLPSLETNPEIVEVNFTILERNF